MKDHGCKATGSCRCPFCDEEIDGETMPSCKSCGVAIIYCSSCGAASPQDAKECPRCRKPVVEEARQ